MSQTKMLLSLSFVWLLILKPRISFALPKGPISRPRLDVTATALNKIGSININIKFSSGVSFDSWNPDGFNIYYWSQGNQKRQNERRWKVLDHVKYVDQKEGVTKVVTNLNPNTTYQLYVDTFSSQTSVKRIESEVVEVTTRAYIPPCPSAIIQSRVHNLKEIKDCEVIEGNLIIFNMKDSEENWKQEGKLKVKEITGFLMIYDVENLTSLDLILPDLAVIRGQELFKNFALVVYGMIHLKDVMLTKLKSILRGSVNIQRNSVLSYYAQKINWNYIAKNGKDHNFVESLEYDMNSCSKNCPQDLCWSYDSCQLDCARGCLSGVCPEAGGGCCHESCVGGCTMANDSTQCLACKHVYDGISCRNECTYGFYKLKNYRCISESDCLTKPGYALFQDGEVKECLSECPSNYQKKKDSDTNRTICKECSASDGGCSKTCPGGFIDSIATAQLFHDCVIIDGSLQIRVNIEGIMTELKENLKNIREIDGFLHIFESSSLTNLDFLESLQVINGNKFLESNYSLIIKDNDNLQVLSRPKHKIRLKKGTANIYRNSKLCPESIDYLVDSYTWPEEIGKLNGYKAYCITSEMRLNVTATALNKKGSISIDIIIPDKVSPDSRKLVGFSIYYRSRDGNQEEADARPWGLEQVEFVGSKEIVNKILTNLIPNATYELHVTSLSTHKSENSFKSEIIKVTTKPFNPATPGKICIEDENHDKRSVTIRWTPPMTTNGQIHHYVIEYEPVLKESILNFCDRLNRTARKMSETSYKDCHEGKDTTMDKQSCQNLKKFPVVDDITQRRKDEVKFADDLIVFILRSTNPDNVRHSRRKREAPRELLIDDKFPPGLKTHLQPMQTERASQNVRMALPLQPSYAHPPALNGRSMEVDLEDFKDWLDILNKFDPEIVEKIINEEYLDDGILEYEEALQIISLMETKAREWDEPQSLKSIESPLYKPHVPQDEIMTVKESYTLTDLTESEYTVKVFACQKPTKEGCPANVKKPCKLCSKFPSTRLVKTPYKKDEITVQNLSVTVLPNRSFIVSWTPLMNTRLPALAYDITLYKENRIIENFPLCQSASTGTETIFEGLGFGNFNVTVSALTWISSETSRTQYFEIEDQETDFTLSYVKWFVLALLPFCSLLFIFLLRRCKIIVFPDIKSAYSNPEYQINPLWKEYFEKVINPRYRFVRADLRITSFIDQGFFGIIQKGILTLKCGDKVQVAAKSPKQLTEKDYSYEILDEASLMIKLKTYHLVKIYGVVTGNPDLFLAMEYMEGGNLIKYLNKYKQEHPLYMLPIDELYKFALQISDGMSFLESKNVAHRDLAARNCLLDDYKNVKISDFGLAGFLGGESNSRMDKEMAVRRMPPEYFGQGDFTSKSDVWSYGVLLWELVTNGERPYNDKSDLQVGEYVKNGGSLLYSVPHQTPPFLGNLMLKCWRCGKDSRPTFNNIVKELWSVERNTEFKELFKTMSFHFMGDVFTDEEELPSVEEEVSQSTPLTTPRQIPTIHCNNYKIQGSNTIPQISPRHKEELKSNSSFVILKNHYCSNLKTFYSKTSLNPFIGLFKSQNPMNIKIPQG